MEVVIVGAEISRRLTLGEIGLRPLDTGTQPGCNRGRHLVLDGEDVAERAVVAFGPNVAARVGVDELRRYPDAIAGLLHTTLEQVAYAELAADLLHVAGPALIDEGRIAGGDGEVGRAGKRRQDRLGNAVAEIVLGRVTAEVVEGQHGQSGLAASRDGLVPRWPDQEPPAAAREREQGKKHASAHHEQVTAPRTAPDVQ